MSNHRMIVIYGWVAGSCASIIIYSIAGILTISLWMATAYLWLLSLAYHFAHPANARWKRNLWKISAAMLPIVGLLLLVLNVPILELF